MSDQYIDTNPWMPNDIWAHIASYLDNKDLAVFTQLCKVAQAIGSDAMLLQPLYNRLYALDNTLPSVLPQEDALPAFKAAFEKIKHRQLEEIAYLTERHPDIMAKQEYARVLQNTDMTLASLEARNAVLDAINSEIIESKIDPNSTALNLNYARITRIPTSLFQKPEYVNFWQNLTQLSCDNNQLTSLNVQGLVALQALYCEYNQLTSLNVQGLVALQGLGCRNNQLTSLNVQGLVALQTLYCNNNELTSLDVQGLVALQRLCCNNNELTSLDVQGLVALQGLACSNNQLTSLNVQSLLALQGLYCNYNQLTSLNVQGLVALQTLWCSQNQLTSLDAQGLVALKTLWCNKNQLTFLNVKGLSALVSLTLNDNPLLDLNLNGVHSDTKNRYAELERSLLINQLSQCASLEEKGVIISRLGIDYSLANHEDGQSLSSLSTELSHLTLFSPFFSANINPDQIQNAPLKNEPGDEKKELMRPGG